MHCEKKGTTTWQFCKELALKVGNGKGGGSGGWLLFEDGFGAKRSMSIYFLMFLLSFYRSISVSCL